MTIKFMAWTLYRDQNDKNILSFKIVYDLLLIKKFLKNMYISEFDLNRTSSFKLLNVIKIVRIYLMI